MIKKLKEFKTLTKCINKHIKTMAKKHYKYCSIEIYFSYQELTKEEIKAYLKALYLPLGFNVELIQSTTFPYWEQQDMVTYNNIEISNVGDIDD